MSPKDAARGEHINDDPDPDARLQDWHAIARQHISAEMCDRLARNGFADLALELLRQRGDLP